MKVIIVNTRYFDFIGIGETEKKAAAALVRHWKTHCANYPGADKDLMKGIVAEREYNCFDMEMNQAATY